MSFRLRQEDTSPLDWETTTIQEAEKTYPKLRQAMRVANVSARSDRKRATCMRRWSEALMTTSSQPAYFYRRSSDGVSGIHAAERWQALYFVGSNPLEVADTHFKVKFKTITGGSMDLLVNKKVMDANFPRLVAAVIRCESLGFTEGEIATAVKDYIFGTDAPAMSLPDFEMEASR